VSTFVVDAPLCVTLVVLMALGGSLSGD